MTQWLSMMISAVVVSLLLAGAEAGAQQKAPDSTTKADRAQTACMDVAGMNQQDRQAMRAFMRSDRAPAMMGRMMEMARGMGNGDVMAGMTRMMDMMGSSGRDGMMGGQGGMMGDHGGMMKSAPRSK